MDIAAADVDMADNADEPAAAIELAIIELCIKELSMVGLLALAILSMVLEAALIEAGADVAWEVIEPAAAAGTVEVTEFISKW